MTAPSKDVAHPEAVARGLVPRNGLASSEQPQLNPAAPMEPLPFAKYHGAGNDFVIVDGRPGARPSTTTKSLPAP